MAGNFKLEQEQVRYRHEYVSSRHLFSIEDIKE